MSHAGFISNLEVSNFTYMSVCYVYDFSICVHVLKQGRSCPVLAKLFVRIFVERMSAMSFFMILDLEDRKLNFSPFLVCEGLNFVKK